MKITIVDTNATTELGVPIDFDTLPFNCIECDYEFGPDELHNQINSFLARKYSRRKLSIEIKKEMIEIVKLWWDKFTSGTNICFICGIGESNEASNNS